MRFLINEGETRTLCKWMGVVDVGIARWPECRAGSVLPLPKTIREEEGLRSESIPDEDDMCDVAPVSRYHSLDGGGGACCCWSDRLLRA